MLALWTSHMITSCMLITCHAALGTKLATIGFLPVGEFMIKGTTFSARVGFLTALKTNFLSTCTIGSLLEHPCLFHVEIASSAWTPHELRV